MQNDSYGADVPTAKLTTINFLEEAQLDPRRTGYEVTSGVLSQLNRALWSSILHHVPSSHFLPREIAPTTMHALLFLERCNWSLCNAQKRAAIEINERRRERLGGVAASSASNTPSAGSYGSLSSTSSPLLTPATAKGKFVAPRSATPPPGLTQDEVMGGEYGEDRRGMPCGHVFKKGEAIYRCRDCAHDETCVLCPPCFNASNHEGHDIVFSVSSSSGGCCDCGDEEAWTQRIGCRFHGVPEDRGKSGADGGPSNASTSASDVTMDEPQSDYMPHEDRLDSKGKAPERHMTTKYFCEQVEGLCDNVPSGVRQAFVSQISSMIAYLLATLEHAPTEMKLPQGHDIIDKIKSQPSLDPSGTDNDEDDDYNFMDNVPGPDAYYFDPAAGRKFSVVLWNDEKHSFKEVIDIVCEATGKIEAEAKVIAERIDRHGREIIETSSEVQRLYLLAHKLAQIDLAVTIRPAYDTFAEELAGHVLEFLLDLANASFFVRDTSLATEAHAHPLDNLVPSAVAMRALIGRAFLDDWQHQAPVPRGEMSLDFFDNRSLVQLDAMFLVDHRMWKGARSNARALYLALIGPREIKRALSYRFACMFPKLVEIFLLQDREPEHSIRFIAVQLFSVPSIATELVVSLDFLHKMFQILQGIFTGQLSTGMLILPSTAPPRMQFSSSSMLLRQQRCYHILFDLRYLLGAEGVRRQIVAEPRHLSYFLDFLALFNSVTPDRRAATEHVEFESEIWVPIFHVATHLARTVKVFGEAYAKGSAHNLLHGLTVAMERTLHSCSQLHISDPDAHASISFERVTFASHTSHIIDFEVETQGVSFHHPMHWLLAEMLKSVGKFDVDFMLEKNKLELIDLFPAELGETGMLVLVDFPLRVVVKLAQIRAGMWVRNGFGIRSQAHHYRDNGMRDVMYDQDLFMLQCSLVFVDPDRMLVTFVQRFSLTSYLEGGGNQTSFETAQVLLMAEELLLVLITLLSEVSMATNWSMDAQVRREIVHFLALNQGTYSELTRHVSDKLKEHVNFDRILASVSRYRAPDGTNDLGIFELKDECYDEVQPFFFHYTRNQREKAEQVLRDRQKRKAPSSEAASRYVCVPRAVLYEDQSIFIDDLREAFASPVLHQIIFASLKNVQVDTGEMPDGLVDSALQLLVMGLVEFGEPFASALCDARNQVESSRMRQSTIELLLALRKDERFVNVKAKVEWILETAARLDVERCGEFVDTHWKSQERKNVDPSQATAEEKRKAAARARQAAIMKQFSAQQKSLLESLEGADDDDEEEDVSGREEDSMDVTKFDDGSSTAKRTSFGSCIFCQEDLNQSQAFGSLAHIQNSRLMRTTPRHDPYSLQQSLQTPLTLDRHGPTGKRVRGDVNLPGFEQTTTAAASASRRQWDGFPAEDRRFGFYASTCGHLMHLECFDVYCRSVEQRHAQQIARNHPEDLARSEFVCPLCKSLGNVVLPASQLDGIGAKPIVTDTTSIVDWIRKINIDILRTSTSVLRVDLQETEHGTGCFVPWYAEDAQVVLDSGVDRHGRERLSSANRQILERLCRVLRPLSTKSRTMRSAHQSRTILAPPSRKMYIPEEVVAYTIAVLEIAQRGTTPVARDAQSPASPTEALNVSDAISDQSTDLVMALIACLRDIAQLEDANYQAIFRHGLLMRLLPHWGGHETVRSPLVLRDPLTVLVEAAVIIPENLVQVTIMMFYVQLIQVVFGVAQPSLWPQSGPGSASRGVPGLRSPHTTGGAGSSGEEAYAFAASDAEALKDVFDDVRSTVANIIGLVGYARGNITLGVDNLDDGSLAKMICTYCLPFLRRAAILQRCIGVLPRRQSADADTSTAMAGVEGDGAATTSLSEPAEFTRLMKLLSIPFPREALSASTVKQTALAGLVEGWIKHAYPQLASIFRPLPIQPSPLSVSTKGGSHHHHHHHHPTLQLEHPHIYELIKLPVNLTSLLMQCQALKCKRCGNAPPEPAICLECGELLCFQSFCCQGTVDGHGECNRHLDECGHATGLFFRIKSNIIILLFQGKGCFTFSPYLDAHGEIDIGLKKGKIQFLHTVRFDELRKQWLGLGLPNMIARKMEAVMDQGGWDTM